MPKVTVASGGAYVAVRGGGRGRGDVTWTRGEVRGLSPASRKRLIDLLFQIDRTATETPLFVTLTYPRVFPDPSDWDVYKGHLRSWLKRLRRAYPETSVVWRLEYQKRGAPHFHVLVFGVSFIPKDWVSRSWYDVVGSGDPRHLRAGTEVARVLTWKGAAFYVCKYLSKTEAGEDVPTGRMWGRSRDLPIDLEDMELSWAAWYRVRRVLRGWYERKTGRKAWWCAQRTSGLAAYLPEREAARVLAWAVGRQAAASGGSGTS